MRLITLQIEPILRIEVNVYLSSYKRKEINCIPCLKKYKKSDMVSELAPTNHDNYTKHSIGISQFLDTRYLEGARDLIA